MRNEFVEFWREAQLATFPFVHPKDLRILEDATPTDLAKPPKHDNFADRFHFGLLPMPYLGDLENADIFVLMHQPGLVKADFCWESHQEHTDAVKRTISQDLCEDNRFLYFDSKFSEHPGANYWKRRFDSEICIEQLAKRLAVIEIVPYHAPTGGRVADHLALMAPSCVAARKFVHDTLLPRAKEREILLICVRQRRNWGFGAHCPKSHNLGENVVIYDAAASRHGYLTPKTAGGQAIHSWLGR